MEHLRLCYLNTEDMAISITSEKLPGNLKTLDIYVGNSCDLILLDLSRHSALQSVKLESEDERQFDISRLKLPHTVKKLGNKRKFFFLHSALLYQCVFFCPDMGNFSVGPNSFFRFVHIQHFGKYQKHSSNRIVEKKITLSQTLTFEKNPRNLEGCAVLLK